MSKGHTHLWGTWVYGEATNDAMGRSRDCLQVECNLTQFEPLGNRDFFSEPNEDDD